MKRIYYKGPNPTRGIPAFAQDPTIAFSGFRPEQGKLDADETSAEKKRGPIRPSFNKFASAKSKIISKTLAMGVPKSTNWRTSAKPIKK